MITFKNCPNEEHMYLHFQLIFEGYLRFEGYEYDSTSIERDYLSQFEIDLTGNMELCIHN